LLHLAQTALHLGAQAAQIGRRHFGVAGNALRLHQHGIQLLQAGAGIKQGGGHLFDRRLRVHHQPLVAKHLLVGFRCQAIHLHQQGIHLCQRGDQLFRVGVVTQQHFQGAVRAFQRVRHRLYIGQALVQAGALTRHVDQVLRQIFHHRHQFGDFSGGVAPQHRALGAVLQRRVGQHATVGADFGVADQAAFHSEHAGGAQPARVFARHVDDDADIALVGQLHPAHAADRKT